MKQPDDEERRVLTLLLDGPQRRDANPALAYGTMTRLLANRWVEADTESTHGAVARMTWRVWRITPDGRRAVRGG